MFISKLVLILKKEDPKWREKTILTIDGEKYRTCEKFQTHLKAISFCYAIFSPYFCTTAPCEFAFAFIKRVDLNLGQQKTGKQ